MSSPTLSLLPFAQATPAQRTQALQYLRARLQSYFPALPAYAFGHLVLEFAPTLRLTGPQVTLPDPELRQLVQYLGHAPELALLDPPHYGPWALELAQLVGHTRELLAGALAEWTRPAQQRDELQLGTLLRQAARPCRLAEQVVQAQRWDLPGSPRLPGACPAERPR